MMRRQPLLGRRLRPSPSPQVATDGVHKRQMESRIRTHPALLTGPLKTQIFQTRSVVHRIVVAKNGYIRKPKPLLVAILGQSIPRRHHQTAARHLNRYQPFRRSIRRLPKCLSHSLVLTGSQICSTTHQLSQRLPKLRLKRISSSTRVSFIRSSNNWWTAQAAAQLSSSNKSTAS